MPSFLTLLSYYLKVYLDFKKSAKQTKSILMTVQDLKIFGIDLFLNISNLSIPLNFIYPKIRNTNLDEHILLCICGLFADRDVMHNLLHDLVWPLRLSKASFDVKCGVEDFALFLFPCLWITVFDPVSSYFPTGPNTFLNRYNLVTGMVLTLQYCFTWCEICSWRLNYFSCFQAYDLGYLGPVSPKLP